MDEIEKSSKFRGSSGPRFTQSLFLEQSYHDKSQVLYSLKDHDNNGYPSLFRLYMEMEDETEYEFATRYFDNFPHWEQIAALSWMKPHVERWRRELRLKIAARALRKLKEHAEHGEGREALASAKYLLEKGWEPKTAANKRGRPSKDEVKQEVQRQAQVEKELGDDLSRITNCLN
jgi:hypothetical protein